MLKELCHRYSKLTECDIEKLESISNVLSLISELVNADVFIDILTKDKNVAVVISEARRNLYSLYKDSVVGVFALRQNEPATLRTLNTGINTRDLKAITQENKTVKQNVVPIKNDENRIIGVLIMENDITDKVNHDINLEILTETSEQLNETLLSIKNTENKVALDNLNDALIIFNEKGSAVYANPIAEQLYKRLGYMDDICGMNFNNIVLNDTNFKEVISNQSLHIFEYEVGGFTLQIKYAVTKKNDKVTGIIMLIKDITEVKEKEKQLILKAVAIQEIHHRVKNNLQTVASILRLQSRMIDNIEVRELFNESINRVLSIAVTHEILAQNGVDDVDIQTILNKLKENILRNSLYPDKIIEIAIIGDSFKINSDKATSIALVVNELLQNCTEHAFCGRNNGRVEVVIQKGMMYSNISITDNGIGFNLEKIGKESLGIRIVKGIIKDRLNGNINIESTQAGSKVMFDFKNDWLKS